MSVEVSSFTAVTSCTFLLYYTDRLIVELRID